MKPGTFSREIEDKVSFPEPVFYEVTFDATPSIPGYVSGPPEDCYPSEPGEIEILTVKLDGLPLQDYGLSSEKLEKIEAYILAQLEKLTETEIFGATYFEPEDCNDC